MIPPIQPRIIDNWNYNHTPNNNSVMTRYCTRGHLSRTTYKNSY